MPREPTKLTSYFLALHLCICSLSPRSDLTQNLHGSVYAPNRPRAMAAPSHHGQHDSLHLLHFSPHPNQCLRLRTSYSQSFQPEVSRRTTDTRALELCRSNVQRCDGLDSDRNSYIRHQQTSDAEKGQAIRMSPAGPVCTWQHCLRCENCIRRRRLAWSFVLR